MLNSPGYQSAHLALKVSRVFNNHFLRIISIQCHNQEKRIGELNNTQSENDHQNGKMLRSFTKLHLQISPENLNVPRYWGLNLILNGHGKGMYPCSSCPDSMADGKCPIYQNCCLQGDRAMCEATFLSKRTKPSFPSQTSPHLTCSDSYTLQILTMGILPLASVQLLISSSFPLKMISLTCPCKRSNLMHVKKV